MSSLSTTPQPSPVSRNAVMVNASANTGLLRVLALCVGLLVQPALAEEIKPNLGGVWQISGVLFAKVHTDEPGTVIGKQVRISRSDLVSPFGECIKCGLKLKQHKASAAELRRDYNAPALEFPHGGALVHELSWPQGRLTVIQVDAKVAYVPVDGRLYVMNQQ